MFLHADTHREISRRFLCVFWNSHVTCTHAHTHTRSAVLKWLCLLSIITLTSFSEPLAQSSFSPKSEYNNTSTKDKETVSQYFSLKIFPGILFVTLQVMHNFN